MSHTTLSVTALRKLAAGTTVHLCKAPFVRFIKGEDRKWHEVPRMGVEPRTLTTAEVFLLGADETKEN